MSLKNDAAPLIADPQWFPSRWNPQDGTIQFVRLTRAEHDSVTFLGDEYLAPLNAPSTMLALSDVARALPPSLPSPQYIFHSAFCGSTLLSRALNVPGSAMSLKEPQILNTVTEAARSNALSRETLQTIVGLLARPFGPNERVVIKPSNVVNLLATGLLEIDSGSNAIFLYAPLNGFLQSIADKGLWGRIFARQLFRTLQSDTGLTFGYSVEETLDLTDLQAAALAWLMHHAQAAALMTRLPGRVRTLNSETFLARRSETILASAAHLRLAISEAKAAEIVDGPVFATHSKQLGQDFNEAKQQSKSRGAIVDEEIVMVATWTSEMANRNGLPMQLPAEFQLIP
jgi:hypothetical protein